MRKSWGAKERVSIAPSPGVAKTSWTVYDKFRRFGGPTSLCLVTRAGRLTSEVCGPLIQDLCSCRTRLHQNTQRISGYCRVSLDASSVFGRNTFFSFYGLPSAETDTGLEEKQRVSRTLETLIIAVWLWDITFVRHSSPNARRDAEAPDWEDWSRAWFRSWGHTNLSWTEEHWQ